MDYPLDPSNTDSYHFRLDMDIEKLLIYLDIVLNILNENKQKNINNMKKYEYLARPLLSQDDLNKLGQDAWELVCMNGTIYIFKREIVEPKTKNK